ncbi:hypothetical protein E8E13_011510 [Curvularia kusanoi]|uniref:Uncharacterized protein n=1 Tax=Curvularia kusanoi TaxID=90978 RepID=A0A9P4WEV4_CURKU|nr:hypothetical protein E8E13_011510 [Curvularia kusanoi]
MAEEKGGTMESTRNTDQINELEVVLRDDGEENIGLSQPSVPRRDMFFQLPREIRDMIYDYVWIKTTHIRQHYQGKSYMLTYGVQPEFFDLFPKTPESASWLLSNRKTMREGLERLDRKVTWHFGEDTMDEAPRQPRASKLIVPAKAHAYQLQIGTPTDHWWTLMNWHTWRTFHAGACWSPTYASPYERLQHIPQMVEFHKHMSLLTSIHVDLFRDGQLPFSMIHTLRTGDEIKFTMQELERLGVYRRLQKFSLALHEKYRLNETRTLERRWRGQTYTWTFDPERVFMEAMLEEVSRIGKIIVRGGKETVMPFEEYREQYVEVEKTGGLTRWDYVIEK